MSAVVYFDDKCKQVDEATTKAKNEFAKNNVKPLGDGQCYGHEIGKSKLPRSVKITCDESLTIKKWNNFGCTGSAPFKYKYDFGKCQRAGDKWMIIKK